MLRESGVLTGGVVAHNEERHVAGAIRSLLDQELPSTARWSTIWVVASGCTDRTVERARAIADDDPRVRVVEEPERLGKAHAIRAILGRADGESLVLLNGDARAEPDAVGELLRTAGGVPAPYAVMGRPCVPPGMRGRWAGTLRLMWEVHHQFHLLLRSEGGGAHLSDELLLLSLRPAPELPDGIINDGSYLGAWLARQGGARLYAPGARVAITIPSRWRDHLQQRRRVRFGHRQVADVLGIAPTSLSRYALGSPASAVRVLLRARRAERAGLPSLAALGAGELAAAGLAGWDLLPPRRDHIRWRRISSEDSTERAGGGPIEARAAPDRRSGATELDRRVASLVEVAGRFRTGVGLDQLLTLLPDEGPSTVAGVAEYVARRPALGDVRGDLVIAAGATPEARGERRARGVAFQARAERVLARDLAGLGPWLRCVGVTGSTAYGEPEAGDDIDFFFVARAGALWACLAYAYLELRFGPARLERAHGPPICLNYALDERAVEREFARDQGLLFAREALTARILRGESYYRGLLGRAPWMAGELPRLYALRRGDDARAPGPPVPLPVRALNLALFPLLAAYLQIAGLRRNRRLERHGRREARFATRTAPRGFAYVSQRFEALRQAYEPVRAAGGFAPAAPSTKTPLER
ncbi:MAG TPA: glycosyltransferase [Thermoplasmata archaeon]|nr:glycosyltransferase [Thermoplasmata archaeon]